MTYDDWKATNPADDALGTIHDDDEREPLAAALDRLLETGEALRAEIERLTDSQWAWRFQWFWGQLDVACRNYEIEYELGRATRLLRPENCPDDDDVASASDSIAYARIWNSYLVTGGQS